MDKFPLNCPFCENEASVMTPNEVMDHDKQYWVECRPCDITQIGLYTYGEAIDRWNRRANKPDTENVPEI